MKYLSFFYKLLEFESKNINKLLEFKVGKIHIYPYIRTNFLSMLLLQKQNINYYNTFTKKNIKIDSFFRILLKGIKNDLNFPKNIKTLVISQPRNRKTFNSKENFDIYYDYLEELIGDNYMIFEEVSIRKKFNSKVYTKNYNTTTYYKIKSRIFSNCKSKINQKFVRYLEEIIFLYQNEFEKFIVFDKEKIIRYFSKFCNDYVFGFNFLNVLKKLKPKILFIFSALSGMQYSIIIKLSKELGIKVVEFQHGLITKSHIAYNYGDAIFKNTEYKKYLPDYLLTYGEFWNKNMRIPVKKITIGNPHFWYNYNKINTSKELKENNKKKILIISQGTLTNIYVKIAKELSKKLSSDYEIIFKLHPGKVAFEERYKELENYNNIIIKKDEDIYELINISDYIVSIYSTTIFEAVALNKPVYIYQHPLSEAYIPKEIGIWFNDVNELYEMIKNDIKSKKNYDINYFWNKNWKENYIKFLKDEIGIEVKK
ncbi:hypothetical protein JCM30566_13700 [Marinitoga arctica]